MGKGGAGKGGRQQISGPRQVGTVIEWKGAFGWIKPLKAISHPKSKGGKVYLAAEDVAAELDGVGAKVSFTIYSDSNGVGAADVRMASAPAPAAARKVQMASGSKVAATFSKGKGNVAPTLGKGKGKVGKAAAALTKVKATFGNGNAGKGATFGKSSNAPTTFVKVSKFGHKVVSSTAPKLGKFASKAVPAKVPATFSKGSGSKGQKSSVVKQTAFQKPKQGQPQKGGATKGKGKGAPSGGKGETKPQRTKIYDKPLIGTITMWKGKFGFIKPNDTIDHPSAQAHQGNLFLHQSDVETEIKGVGARVRFMLYEDSRGLGASNVRAA